MIKYLIPAMMAGCVALPAAAQTNSGPDSPFDGPKIEILGGYDTLRSGSDVDIDTDDTIDGDGPDQSIDGFAYGIAAGYDFDLGNVVLGLEAEFMDTTGKQDRDETISAPFGYQVNLSRDIYLGARVGYKVTPVTLLYAKGGYTSTRVESVLQDELQDDGIDLVFDDSQSIEGYRIGAGIEQVLGGDIFGSGPNTYAKLEYRYSNYSDLDYDDTLFSDGGFETDLDRHQIMAGIGVRF
jgi:outer membrane immunogenic protein